jgi:hypothetical protein
MLRGRRRVRHVSGTAICGLSVNSVSLTATCPVCWVEMPLPPVPVQTCLTTNLAASYLKVEVGDLPLLQHTCQVPVVPRETS